MAYNFSRPLSFDGKTVLAVFVPQYRTNGQYYEVNVKDYPRFYMAWSSLGRYDLTAESGTNIPYKLILAASDAIEEEMKKM